MPQPLRVALLVLTGAGMIGLLVYSMARAFQRAEDPAKLAFKWIVTIVICAGLAWNTNHQMKSGGGSFVGGAITGMLIVFPCLAAAIIFAIMWAPSLGKILFGPLLSAFD